jgi:hypothetical protein
MGEDKNKFTNILLFSLIREKIPGEVKMSYRTLLIREQLETLL